MTHQWNPADYAEHSGNQLIWAEELISQLTLLGPEQILDLGCGDGKVSALLASKVPHGAVLGLDSAANMVELAQERFPSSQFPNLSFQVMDIRRLDYNQSFDVVFSNAVLHWIQDHLSVLQGIQRALRPGGRALLQMGGRGNAAGILAVLDSLISQDPWRPYFQKFTFPYHFYAPDDYLPWLAQVGLSPRRLELIDKDMLHEGEQGLAGWLRTTWHPFLSQIPEAKQKQFLGQWVDDYVNQNPIDERGMVHVAMVRLEVLLHKP